MREVWQKKMVPSLDILPLYAEVMFFSSSIGVLDYSVVRFVFVGKWIPTIHNKQICCFLSTQVSKYQ
jgi:hypothetical protein